VLLIASAQKVRTADARYGGEDAELLPIDLETECIEVASDTHFQTAQRMIGQWNATESDMPKHDHHKAAGHHEEAAKSHQKAAELHEEGEHEQATQHSQLANDHSKKAQEAASNAHQNSKGPKTL